MCLFSVLRLTGSVDKDEDKDSVVQLLEAEVSLSS